MRNRQDPKFILTPYRELIEHLVRENPTISNQQIADQLPIYATRSTVSRYRKQLGLPSNPPSVKGEIDKYREQIEQWVRENPKITNQKIAERLPIKFGVNTVARFRQRLGLPNKNHSSFSGKSVLDPFLKKIKRLVKKNPGITNREIAALLPVEVSTTTIGLYRSKLGLPSSPEYRNHILDPYRKQIECLIENNPQISNPKIAKLLPIRVNQCTVATYRHRLGLPCNPVSKIDSCRELIVRLINENPKISNRKLLKLLPIQVDNTTLAQYRHKLGLPVNPAPQEFGIERYRDQIEQLVRENPKISNRGIMEQLSLTEITEVTIGRYRRLWGLPCNTGKSFGIQDYRKTIEQHIKNNPKITNGELAERLPIAAMPGDIGYFRRKWKLPCNPAGGNPVKKLAEYHEQIEQMIQDNPNITNREITKRLPIKVCSSTVASYRKTSGLPCCPKF